NPSSVNSLRVITVLCEDGSVKVIGACLRMGNGEKYADNFHHGGISALVDVKTGIVTTPGSNGKSEKFILHPKTGKKIIGFEIPHWDKVIETINVVAKQIPTVRHVGWDIAISKDGHVVIIE